MNLRSELHIQHIKHIDLENKYMENTHKLKDFHEAPGLFHSVKVELNHRCLLKSQLI